MTDDNIQRGITAQLEVLNLIDTFHQNDRQGFDELLRIAVSTPEDLARAAIVVADMALTLPDPDGFNHRLSQLRAAFSRAGGAQ
ncbi:hypothetical protein [Mycolicibacterium sp. D5.8-2]|uniref:hypothetical protein n=1 Tax=Mycolicibacterium sp. D5.8-2 TaxID=3085903 RepID=UPI00298CE893|nr:hypothetical protein [Mycolicibacterium sp. D5.8-2]MDW5612080.1 hypothetical protein [Mycolicibacterium sp. D5.8-2]